MEEKIRMLKFMKLVLGGIAKQLRQMNGFRLSNLQMTLDFYV